MTNPNALKDALSNVQIRTKAGQLRRVMPEIDRLVRDGAKHEDIVAELTKAGVHGLTVNTLRTNLYRWRKRQGKAGANGATVAPNHVLSTREPAPVQAPSGASVAPKSVADVVDAHRESRSGAEYTGLRKPFKFEK